MERTCMLLVLLTVSLSVYKTSATSPMMSPCDVARDCSECLAISPECIWCLSVRNVDHRPVRQQCQPRHNTDCLEVERSTEFSSRVLIHKALALKPKLPITPQKMELTLRKGATESMVFTVLTRKPNFEVTLRYSKAFDVTVQSECEGFEWKKKKASCKGVSPGKIKFRMNVKLKKRCPKKPKKIKVMVTLNNKKKRSLKVKVKSICSCDCERESDVVRKSPRCSNKGDYVCGGCQCDAGVYGKYCECDPESTEMMCTSPRDGSICSNHGQCVCGQCECNALSPSTPQRFTGRYCECNDYACERFNGEICGGPTRGRCACGVCQCFEDFTGSDCGISRSTQGCLSRRSRSICNNVGVCIDNECKCLGNNRGPTCDECSAENPWDCTTTCVGLRPCVECAIFKSGSLNEEECRTNCSHVIDSMELVDNVAVQERGGRDFKLCMLRDSDFCLMKFGYDFSAEHRTQIRVERTRMCPEP